MNILKFRLHKIPHITVFLMFRMYHVFYREIPVLSKKNREIFYETVHPEQIGSKTFQAQKTMFFFTHNSDFWLSYIVVSQRFVCITYFIVELLFCSKRFRTLFMFFFVWRVPICNQFQFIKQYFFFYRKTVAISTYLQVM